MPYGITGKLEGLQGVLRRLDGLAKKVQKKITRDAVGQASKILLREAKARAPKGSGLLKKSLGRKVKVMRGSGIVIAVVGPRKGFKQQVTRDGRTVMSDPVRYAHLVELGTSHSAAKPFLGPAFDATRDSMVESMTNVILNGIEDAAGSK